MIELWVIRHGDAEPVTPAQPNDAERPLTEKGHAQAASLAGWIPPLDRLLVSPLRRAVETAVPIAAHAAGGLEVRDALAYGSVRDVIALLEAEVQEAHGPLRLAIVGHEPTLSELVGRMIAGTVGAPPARIKMRKGALAELQGSVLDGGMTLTALQRG